MTAKDEPTSGEQLVFEYDLDAPPEKVWRALTVPALMDEWLGRPDSADPTEPGCYEIIDAQPQTFVRLAWREEGEDRPNSEVTFEIEPRSGGRTRFRLTHAAKAPATMSAANGNAPPLLLAA